MGRDLRKRQFSAAEELSAMTLEVEGALKDLSSEDAAVQEAAVNALIAGGDPALLPKLEEVRATADRSVRMAIKPVIDLLKNRGEAGKSGL